MKQSHLIIAAVVAIVGIVLVFRMFPRYEIQTMEKTAYKLDRWTGETTLLYGGQERPTVPAQPSVDWSRYELVKPAPTRQ